MTNWTSSQEATLPGDGGDHVVFEDHVFALHVDAGVDVHVLLGVDCADHKEVFGGRDAHVRAQVLGVAREGHFWSFKDTSLRIDAVHFSAYRQSPDDMLRFVQLIVGEDVEVFDLACNQVRNGGLWFLRCDEDVHVVSLKLEIFGHHIKVPSNCFYSSIGLVQFWSDSVTLVVKQGRSSKDSDYLNFSTHVGFAHYDIVSRRHMEVEVLVQDVAVGVWSI